MKPKVIYVAGPYSAPDAWGREQNIRRAELVALCLWRAGVPAICVHTIARYFYGSVAEADALTIDHALLERADGIMLVEGWPDSAGTRSEIAFAKHMNLRVFQAHEIGACIAWARGET